VDKSNQATIKAFGRQVTDNLHQLPETIDPESGEPIKFGQTNANLVSLYSQEKDANHYRIANTIAPDFMGRTPGGTPTGALMALLYGRGDYALSTRFENTSPVQTSFRGSGKSVTLASGTPALVTTIGTKSWLMGIHHFVIDPTDPFPTGFIV